MHPHRTLYIDYITEINGIQTAIRVFEIEASVFIFINQITNEIQRYDASLEKLLKQNWQQKGKKRVVMCNLQNKEHLKDVCNVLVELYKQMKHQT
ncbi:hypothetical protein COBT_001374 [Conglomerata obtusa]